LRIGAVDEFVVVRFRRKDGGFGDGHGLVAATEFDGIEPATP
jgi:hypothetical protein